MQNQYFQHLFQPWFFFRFLSRREVIEILSETRVRPDCTTSTRLKADAHMYTYIYIHTHIYKYIYIYPDIYIHIYMHKIYCISRHTNTISETSYTASMLGRRGGGRGGKDKLSISGARSLRAIRDIPGSSSHAPGGPVPTRASRHIFHLSVAHFVQSRGGTKPTPEGRPPRGLSRQLFAYILIHTHIRLHFLFLFLSFFISRCVEISIRTGIIYFNENGGDEDYYRTTVRALHPSMLD